MARDAKRVGVVLAGCGFLDGAEIHEATLSLLFLDRAGAKVVAAAPDGDQLHVVDHLTGKQAAGERRNALVEAARIARGQVVSLAGLHAEDLDALVVPGGFGAAKNLCSFATDGAGMRVRPDLERLILALHAGRKPMGFVCIAPVIAARVLGAHRPRLTVGDDPEAEAAMASWGADPVKRGVGEVAVDEVNRLVSTPAYMLGPSIASVALGIERMVARVLELA